MPIDHSAPPDTEAVEIQSSGPLNDYFEEFMSRVIAGADGVSPSDAVREGMRAFFFCGANATISMLFSNPMPPAQRAEIVKAMSAEISGTAFFRAAAVVIGTTH